nr:MAG TPA: portal protein [Siphoviridae sp. ctYIp7]
MGNNFFIDNTLPANTVLKMSGTLPSVVKTPVGETRDWKVEDLFVSPFVCGRNYMELFYSVPEVFFPIDYIASRIAGSGFQLKKVKDDSIVWENRRMNQILTKPNCMMSWKDIIYSHFVYKLCTGNAFFRAAMGETFKDQPKWKWCNNYWELPADYVQVEPNLGTNVPMFGIATLDDIVRCYSLNYGYVSSMDIPSYQIWHDRDGLPEYMSIDGFMKSQSRLASHLKPIANLIAVYEARNVIYVKRGGLGFLVSQKKDEAGTVAMTKEEKMEILDEHYDRFGLDKKKLPYGISDIPLTFIRTNLSISELQPFEETLTDAIQIAGAYGIPSVLVPRKDQSTFSNQSTAEKAVYTSTIIPMARQFCRQLTGFLGLEEGGYYLDCDFSDVDCLQQGLKEAEEVKTMVNARCREQFLSGLISINDWRAQINESRFEDSLFDKTLFAMSDEERDKIKQVISLNTKSEVENGRENQKPAV